MLDELDQRKQRVLKAVIDDYIESAEPVGSRTLARKYNLGVSPATIRNEMADLEMLGYLEHLHTSSGRVPSSKGYRFYVDGLIPPKPVSDEEKALIDRWYKGRVQRIEEVFQETARIISQVTRNVSLVLAPQMKNVPNSTQKVRLRAASKSTRMGEASMAPKVCGAGRGTTSVAP